MTDSQSDQEIRRPYRALVEVLQDARPRCRQPIVRQKAGGRSSFACGACQV